MTKYIKELIPYNDVHISAMYAPNCRANVRGICGGFGSVSCYASCYLRQSRSQHLLVRDNELLQTWYQLDGGAKPTCYVTTQCQPNFKIYGL